MEPNMGKHLTHHKYKITHGNDQEVHTTAPNLDRLRLKHTQQTDKKQQQFCPKVCNQSGVHFTEDEIQLLSRGLKYNLHFKPKHWIKTLALEAESAISYAEEHEQNYLRHAVSRALTINQ
jgi:hypothetical protein